MNAKLDYEHFEEVAPNIFVDDYQTIHIVDEKSEIASWNNVDWENDPDVFHAAINSIYITARYGTDTLRDILTRKKSERSLKQQDKIIRKALSYVFYNLDDFNDATDLKVSEKQLEKIMNQFPDHNDNRGTRGNVGII
jgi:hypothetical protein